MASDITVDLWQTFDFTTLDTTNLAANDHASVGTWSIANADSRLSTTTDSEKLLPGTVNTSLDDSGGTRGLSYVLNGTDFQEGTVTYTFSSSKSAVSVGWWFKFPSGYVGSFEGGQPDLITIEGGTAARALFVKLTDADQGQITLFTPEQGSSSPINVEPGTWYWITAYYGTGGATHKLRVYNTSGSLVGSEQTRTGSTQLADFATFGNLIGDESGVTGAAFEFDDLVMDWSSATFPIGPPLGDPEPFRTALNSLTGWM